MLNFCFWDLFIVLFFFVLERRFGFLCCLACGFMLLAWTLLHLFSLKNDVDITLNLF